MANAWTIGHDKKVFDPSLGDTEDFVPKHWFDDRRLRSDLPLPVFGQGRRIYQGKRVAIDGAFLNITHLLWVFDVEACKGEDMDPWSMAVVWFMTEPKPFKFRLKLGGEWVLDVAREEWEGTEKHLDVVMGVANDVENEH